MTMTCEKVSDHLLVGTLDTQGLGARTDSRQQRRFVANRHNYQGTNGWFFKGFQECILRLGCHEMAVLYNDYPVISFASRYFEPHEAFYLSSRFNTDCFIVYWAND
jgi:hypothetical protein